MKDKLVAAEEGGGDAPPATAVTAATTASPTQTLTTTSTEGEKENPSSKISAMETTQEGTTSQDDGDKTKMIQRSTNDADAEENGSEASQAATTASASRPICDPHDTSSHPTSVASSSMMTTPVPPAFQDLGLPMPTPQQQPRPMANDNDPGIPGAFQVEGFGFARTSTNRAPGRLTSPIDDATTAARLTTTGLTVDTTSSGGTATGQDTAAPTDVEQLLSATLVPEGDGDVVQAEPAPEGFKAILQNKRFKYVLAAFVLVMVAVIVPTSILLPKPDENDRLLCGSSRLEQMDYRGTISTTVSGKTCQRWDEQTPHSHMELPWEKPWAGLEANYCRNPNQSPRAYVTFHLDVCSVLF